ncbi:MAG TPA: GTPase Era [Xanthobacteraceae bacterium]|jgi:GTP-binding protein Era
MPDVAEKAGATRCGFVAIVGAPNVGKSTLVNELVGTKVSIVSPKVQTTRIRVRGIAVVDQSQIIFVDTPGIFEPRRRLDRAMVAAAWSGAGDADLVALVIDATRGLDEETVVIANRLGSAKAKKLLIINKIDLVKRDTLLGLVAEANALTPFERTFMVSASKGDGVADVRDYIAGAVSEGPWLFPADELSDLSDRVMAAEVTREKMFLKLHDELPYQSTVETDSWKELANGSIRIEQTAFVERESQRKIMLGEGGSMIKAISMAARKEISDSLGKPVHLFLHVKVRGDWENDPERYRTMGLDFPKG